MSEDAAMVELVPDVELGALVSRVKSHAELDAGRLEQAAITSDRTQQAGDYAGALAGAKTLLTGLVRDISYELRRSPNEAAVAERIGGDVSGPLPAGEQRAATQPVPGAQTFPERAGEGNASAGGGDDGDAVAGRGGESAGVEPTGPADGVRRGGPTTDALRGVASGLLVRGRRPD